MAVFATMLAGCAAPRPVAISHLASGLQIDLPPGFIDQTAEALRRHRERGDPLRRDVSAEPLMAFSDDAGARGCLLSRLLTQGSALQLTPTSTHVAELLSQLPMQLQPSRHRIWPVLARGYPIGLNGDGSLPTPPQTHTVVSSRQANIGTRPAWLVITQQQWPQQAGAYQGATQAATMAADLGPSFPDGRQWLVVQCGANHLPDYVGGYLDEVLESVADARWQPPGPAETPLAKSSTVVPQ